MISFNVLFTILTALSLLIYCVLDLSIIVILVFLILIIFSTYLLLQVWNTSGEWQVNRLSTDTRNRETSSGPLKRKVKHNEKQSEINLEDPDMQEQSMDRNWGPNSSLNNAFQYGNSPQNLRKVKLSLHNNGSSSFKASPKVSKTSFSPHINQGEYSTTPLVQRKTQVARRHSFAIGQRELISNSPSHRQIKVTDSPFNREKNSVVPFLPTIKRALGLESLSISR